MFSDHIQSEVNKLQQRKQIMKKRKYNIIACSTIKRRRYPGQTESRDNEVQMASPSFQIWLLGKFH